jgi:hypothetical protein
VKVVKQRLTASADRNKDGSQGILYLVTTGLPGDDTSLDYKQITTTYPSGEPQRSGWSLPWKWGCPVVEV